MHTLYQRTGTAEKEQITMEIIKSCRKHPDKVSVPAVKEIIY